MYRFGILALSLVSCLSARELVDRVAAVVDQEMILESDVNTALAEVRQRPEYARFGVLELRAKILDRMIDDQVLLAKARMDTLDATDAEVKERVNEQVRIIAAQQKTDEPGLAKMIKAQMGITLDEFKHNILAKQFREQMAQQRIRAKYLGQSIPSALEVESFFQKYADSLPTDKDVWNLSRIQFKITPNLKLIDSIQKQAQKVLKLALDGQNFERLVDQYSMDSSSRADGGDLGFYKKGALDPHYEAAAFQMENGQIVERPVLSKLGYHVIKVLDKRDNEIRTAHILFPIVPTLADTQTTQVRAKSLRDSIIAGMSFESLALKYSDDKLSAVKGGQLGWLPKDQMDPVYVYKLQSLKVGEISEPFLLGEHWHLLKVNSFEADHKLNLDQDREKITQLAAQYLSNQKLIDLMAKWRKQVHIEIR